MNQKKAIKTVSITVIVTVATMLAACCIFIGGIIFVPDILSSFRLRPVYQAADTFMADLKAGDYESASALLTPDALQRVGTPANLPTYFGIEPVASYKRGISITSTGGQKVEVAYGVTFTDSIEGSLWLGMINEDGVWKVGYVTFYED